MQITKENGGGDDSGDDVEVRPMLSTQPHSPWGGQSAIILTRCTLSLVIAAFQEGQAAKAKEVELGPRKSVDPLLLAYLLPGHARLLDRRCTDPLYGH